MILFELTQKILCNAKLYLYLDSLLGDCLYLDSIQYLSYTIQCTTYTIHVRRTLYTVRRTLYTVRYIVYAVY